MHKLLKLFLFLGLGIIIATLVLVVGLNSITDFSANILPISYPISGILFFVNATVCWVIFAYLIHRYRLKHQEMTQILLVYFFFTAIAMSFQGFFDIWGFNNVALNWYGTQMNFLWISESAITMAFFIFDVFKNGLEQGHNKRWFLLLATIAVVFDAFIALGVFIKNDEIGVILLGLVFYIVILTVFTTLTRSGFYLARRVRNEDKISSTAFRLMGLSGLILLLAYIMVFVYIIMKAIAGSLPEFEPFDYAALIILGVGYITLFLGFLYPMVKKKEA